MATDDYAPQPIAPGLAFIEEEATDNALLAKDQEKAKSYFHPAWTGVEKLFTERIEALRIGCTDNKLDPVQYAVEDRANKKAAAIVMDIWSQVQDAVIATERPKGDK